jgi:hypothetical protein
MAILGYGAAAGFLMSHLLTAVLSAVLCGVAALRLFALAGSRRVWVAGLAVAALVMLGVTPDAAAAEAPLCDPSGASVAAVPEVRPADSGHIDPLPCDSSLYRAWFGIELEEPLVVGSSGFAPEEPAPPPPRQIDPAIVPTFLAAYPLMVDVREAARGAAHDWCGPGKSLTAPIERPPAC